MYFQLIQLQYCDSIWYLLTLSYQYKIMSYTNISLRLFLCYTIYFLWYEATRLYWYHLRMDIFLPECILKYISKLYLSMEILH